MIALLLPSLEILELEKKDEADGEKESKPVTVNSDNQSLTMGDDTKYYKLDGNQLTIEDGDHNPNDMVVLTK
ncbi:hypothetical protein [Streptococcus thermophilus]|uniref:DUF3642 domain-containing protein n=3 Tax=Streptococcus thermophilus TaxID=1308 RepID=A0A8D6U994_STRTR|nr:protein of unknown function [Streptococcus thermophilus]CAD0144246.1 protein of unknown function [Streptococcus thermophilus]CAD0151906.1 protein of unknown function [Streptococcus thermophilus]